MALNKSILEYLKTKSDIDSTNEIINHINENINGRVCMSKHLYCLYLIGKYMGDECKTYAEIGTLWGGSLSLMLQLTGNRTYIGIDLFEGYYGKKVFKNDWNGCNQNIDGDNHVDFTRSNVESFNKYNQKHHLIKGSSYEEETVQKVREITKSIDLLFIDGDHSEVGVTKDFIKYKDFISDEGYILFDNYGDPNNWVGVKIGLDKIDFPKHGFKIIDQIGYSLLIQKTKGL